MNIFLGFIDSTHTNRRYWLPSGETQHSSANTSTIRYGMPDIPETGMAPHDGSGVYPGAVPIKLST